MRRLIEVAALVICAATGTLPSVASATEKPEGCLAGYIDPKTLSYVCTQQEGEERPGADTEHDVPAGDSSEPADPTCELSGEATWCDGEIPCWTEPTTPPVELPTEPKPQPDSKSLTDWCFDHPGGGSSRPVRTYWSDEEPQAPSLEEQMETAIGQLRLELPPLATSPTDRTLVNLPTWFWVEGGEEAAEQTGSSAFGLVAIATVRGLSIETGDGETLTCDWVTSAEEAEQECSYVYSHASQDGPYEVSARSTWDVRFEMNGNPVDIPGAPGTLDGPASTATLQVDEVQSTVEEVR